MRRRVFGLRRGGVVVKPARGGGGACLAVREAAWAEALLCGDEAGLARVAALPLPVDAPVEARERWHGRRAVLAAAGLAGAADLQGGLGVGAGQ